MENELLEIRERQKTTWNKFSSEWKKWDELLMTSLQPLNDEMLRLLEINDTDLVLDLASGTGEPGLSIAAKLNQGKVVFTDLSENMLEVARGNAVKRGIDNIETRVCGACELPFPDNTFDAISCRLGFMFFPDMLLAAKEMHRVLKPGGKLVTVVWNTPEKNFWATAIAGVIFRNLKLAPPPPDTPGLFRCAKSGLVQDLLQQAGFHSTGENEVNSKIDFGNVDTYWNLTTDVTAPLTKMLNRADKQMKHKIKAEVYQIINEKFPNGDVRIDGSTLVIYGMK